MEESIGTYDAPDRAVILTIGDRRNKKLEAIAPKERMDEMQTMTFMFQRAFGSTVNGLIEDMLRVHNRLNEQQEDTLKDGKLTFKLA